jgi:hypothetical protein
LLQFSNAEGSALHGFAALKYIDFGPHKTDIGLPVARTYSDVPIFT